MDYIENSIRNYLKIKTDYAILINGPWGSGKSHYFRNHLSPIINSLKPDLNNEKNYKVFMISLYGIESIQDLQSIILTEFLEYLKNPAVKIVTGISKLFFKAVAKIDKTDINEFIHKTLKDDGKNNLFDYSGTIFCFDDFERRSEKLNLSEILGFINSLTQDSVKVIIIANEQKDKQIDDFKIIKEKVIGVTIDFKPETNVLVKEIINSKYSSQESYRRYLSERIELISCLVDKNEHNLRSLIYALDCQLDIYTYVQLNFQDENEEKQKEINDALLTFSIAIAIEYRMGKISYSTIRKIKVFDHVSILEDSSFSFRSINSDENRDSDDSNYRDYFKGKYYNNNHFIFYDSIYKFITTYDSGFLRSLIGEIKATYVLGAEKEPEYIIAYKQLYHNPLRLSDEEYEKNGHILLNALNEGKFEDITEYYNSFVLLLRYENPLGFDVTELLSSVMNGLKKAILSVYSFGDDIEDIDEGVKYSENINELKSLLVRFSNEQKKREMLEKTNELFQRFKNDDFENFYSFLRKSRLHYDYSYFEFFSAKEVVKTLRNKDLHFVLEFTLFVENRYNVINHTLAKELAFIKDMHKLLLEEEVDKRRKIIYKNLIDTFSKVIVKISDVVASRIMRKLDI